MTQEERLLSLQKAFKENCIKVWNANASTLEVIAKYYDFSPKVKELDFTELNPDNKVHTRIGNYAMYTDQGICKLYYESVEFDSFNSTLGTFEEELGCYETESDAQGIAKEHYIKAVLSLIEL